MQWGVIRIFIVGRWPKLTLEQIDIAYSDGERSAAEGRPDMSKLISAAYDIGLQEAEAQLLAFEDVGKRYGAS